MPLLQGGNLEKHLLTVEETAMYLGLSKGTLYNWAHQRRLPFVKMGWLIRFDKNEIDQWIEKRRTAARYCDDLSKIQDPT